MSKFISSYMCFLLFLANSMSYLCQMSVKFKGKLFNPFQSRSWNQAITACARDLGRRRRRGSCRVGGVVPRRVGSGAISAMAACDGGMGLWTFYCPGDSKINQKISRAIFTFTFFDLLAPRPLSNPNLEKSSILAFSLLEPIRLQTSFGSRKTHS